MADDPEVARLYQLPLDSFTNERNALAKKLGQPAIKQLAKPSVPAWAVNQLFWRHRTEFDRLNLFPSDRLEQHSEYYVRVRARTTPRNTAFESRWRPCRPRP